MRNGGDGEALAVRLIQKDPGHFEGRCSNTKMHESIPPKNFGDAGMQLPFILTNNGKTDWRAGKARGCALDA